MKYGTDWREDVHDDEEASHAASAEQLAQVQRDRNERYGQGRALHRQAVGGVRAELRVRDDLEAVLPPELRVGPLVAGARYLAYVRFSHGNWEPTRKDRPDVRGIAVKLVGVPGRKALTGTEEPGTLDLLLIGTRAIPAVTAYEFVSLVSTAATGSELLLFPRLGWTIGYGRAFAIVKETLAGLKRPFPSYATGTYNSVVPFRLGPTACRFGLRPLQTEAPASHAATLTEELTQRLQQGLRRELQVQLYQDAASTPIEDPRVDWPSELVTVATLEIPPVDVTAGEGLAISEYVEKLSFDPWHTVEEMRPLGAMNRARKAVYFASTRERVTVPEPDGSETFEATAASASVS